ncbi:MAG: amino acid racemase [Spirochaetia bacterium]|nr:amino acid racemase [Spirochaetia bacterium]
MREFSLDNPDLTIHNHAKVVHIIDRLDKGITLRELGGHTIGILGGMGPVATLDLYGLLISSIRRDKAITEARHIVINNIPVPNLFQQPDGFIRGYLAEQTRLLETAGAKVIGVCCNSAHHFFASMRQALSDEVVLVDLIQEVCLSTEKNGFRRPGVFSSTMARPLYEQRCKSLGLNPVMLDSAGQGKVDQAISRILYGERGPELLHELDALAADSASRGADCVILGCTDLPLVMTSDTCPLPLISSTAVLASALARFSGDPVTVNGGIVA